MRRLMIAALFFAFGCAPIDYAGAPEGRFDGRALVVWVGDSGGSGDGKFVYVPFPDQELKFFRSPEADVTPGNQTIVPDAFYTDGGSLPRAVQTLPGFNAWAFGPAYIVHDWLYVVRKCANDGKAWALQSPIAEMSFGESAEIMAETIKTVTEQYDLNPSKGNAGAIIAPVTAGPISYRLWTAVGDCEDPTTDKRIQRVLADITGKVARGAALPRASDADEGIFAQSLDAPYLIVAEIGFPNR